MRFGIGLTVALLLVTGCTGASEDTSPPAASTTSESAPTTSSHGIQATTTPTSLATSTTGSEAPDAADLEVVSFPVPPGSGPHDVAPGIDGSVWYTAQASGDLGRLDPVTGATIHVDLGPGSSPHGVIVDSEGTPWVTDSGLNAIVSVHPATQEVTRYELPADAPDANLNTASFDGGGVLWFTGQSGFYGSLDPGSGEMTVYRSPEGRGPYGITTTPAGVVYYASLAGSHIARIETDGSATVIEPPTPDQGARRVWSDSSGNVWVSEWNSGNLSRFSPDTGTWSTWRLPGDDPQTYAVFVDDLNQVWASDFGSNSIVRFDPATEVFEGFPLPHQPGNVRQILGRPGEVWAPESAADSILVIKERGG